jgi:enterochelin esterase-like enzyme
MHAFNSSGFAAEPVAANSQPFAGGTLRLYRDFPSAEVGPHNVYVWTPQGYESSGTRYDVLYMQDGQNLFVLSENSGMVHHTWGVAEHLQALVAAHKAQPAIIVGIWNTARRGNEYAATGGQDAEGLAQLAADWSGPIVGDAYVRFLTAELKPFVDRRYRTLAGPRHTFAMGSSMGGVASLNLMLQHPEIFGGVACLSTHWPIRNPRAFFDYQKLQALTPRDVELASRVSGNFLRFVDEHLPSPQNHRLYFDHGDATLDSYYAAFQQKMDAILRRHGYVEGESSLSLFFPGEPHSEEAWEKRMDRPLLFLLGN